MAGEFSFIYFLCDIHAQKNKMEIPCLVLLLGGAGGFFVCFLFVLCFFLHSITCNSHCATVIDSVFVSTFSNKIWPFFLHQFRKFLTL